MIHGHILKRRWLFNCSLVHLFISSLVEFGLFLSKKFMSMNTNLKYLKILFPDILSLFKALNNPKSENVMVFNYMLKVISEDNELLQRLAK